MRGYMGFGMQKWIYSRKSRTKLYVRETIPSFTSLPKYSRTFQLKASVKENKLLNGILAIGIAISLIILSGSFIKKYTDYSNEQTKQVTIYNNYENEKAFNFLVESGISRLAGNNIIGAYSEFKLAHEIHQNDEKFNQLFIETLSILCNDDEKYCNELDYFLLEKI